MEGKKRLVPALFKVTWNSARSGKRIALPTSSKISVGDKFKCNIIEEDGEPLKLLYTQQLPEEPKRELTYLEKKHIALQEEKEGELTDAQQEINKRAEELHLKNVNDEYPNDKFYDMEGT